MEWHVNDLSLNGQHASSVAFLAALTPILKVRREREGLRSRIYCSRTLPLRPATKDLTVRQAIVGGGDRLLQRLALEWFDKGGPFWEDSRAENADDYFHFEGSDVTDLGPGEAARRRIRKVDARTLSFEGSGFERSPLGVVHGLQEEPLGVIEVPNVWDIAGLGTAVPARLESWRQLIAESKTRFPELIFSSGIESQLHPSPFHGGVASRVLDLLAVLHEMVQETGEEGALSSRGLEILQNHFVGEKAWFTDESERNKRDFLNELTFRDPIDVTKLLFCPWHGKEKNAQFRVHFEWPRPTGQRRIKVLYIGPKIAKR